VLEDLVVRDSESQLWRASDPALQRAVGVRLIPLSEPRSAEIAAAAKAAAGVHDRRVVQVLDVVETRRHLAIVSEWVPGRPWSEVLREDEERGSAAAVVAYEVALALQSAHALGVTHGRLRPNSVIISDTNEVRLRGLGVDAALYGVAPGSDARAADLHGVGALLYAGLTKRWPEPAPTQAFVDGLPVVGPINGQLLSPAELTAAAPSELSTIAAACIVPAVRPRTRKRIPDVDHAAAALAKAIKHDASPAPAVPEPEPMATTTDRVIRRVASVVIIGITIAAAVLFIGSLRQGSVIPAQDAGPAPSPSASPTGAGAANPQPLSIASSTDFDPQGSDGTENPELVPLATDGDLETAWTTVAYKSSSMNPKSGTGLLLDLGLARPISAVQIDFYGTGHDVEIRVAEEEGDRANDYELLAGAVAAGEEITIRVPIPVQTRYVLVWLTNLPYQEGTYIGGIREVKVLG
jgi:serine/threonine protein kinase